MRNNINIYHLSDCYSLKDYVFYVLPHHTAMLDWADMENNDTLTEQCNSAKSSHKE